RCVLAGASGQPALDRGLERRLAGPRARARGAAVTAGAGAVAVSRRDAILRALGATGALTLGIGGLSVLLKGSYKGGARSLSAASSASAAPRRTEPRSTAHRAESSLPSGAVRLGSSSRLPSGQGA